MIDGWLSNDDKKVLQKYAKGKVLEIGTFKGKSAVAMSENATVVTIDNFKNPNLRKEARENIREKNVISLKGRSEVLIDFINTEFDMLFIDGKHSSKQLKIDFGEYEKWLKVDGVVAFHDYGHKDFPDVKEFVDNSNVLKIRYTRIVKTGDMILFRKVK